jgi:hypothetical protein
LCLAADQSAERERNLAEKVQHFRPRAPHGLGQQAYPLQQWYLYAAIPCAFFGGHCCGQCQHAPGAIGQPRRIDVDVLPVSKAVDPGQEDQQASIPVRDAIGVETDIADVAVCRQLLFDIAGMRGTVFQQPASCQYQLQVVRGRKLNAQFAGHGK